MLGDGRSWPSVEHVLRDAGRGQDDEGSTNSWALWMTGSGFDHAIAASMIAWQSITVHHVSLPFPTIASRERSTETELRALIDPGSWYPVSQHEVTMLPPIY